MDSLFLTTLVVIGTIHLSESQNVVPYVVHDNVINEKGYQFSYKTADSERMETGAIDESKGESGVIIVSGSYSFIADDGRTYKVDFVADENGYRPVTKLEGHSAVLTKSQKPYQEPPPGRRPFVPYVSSAALASLTGGGLG